MNSEILCQASGRYAARTRTEQLEQRVPGIAAQYFRATELKVGHQFQSGFADYIKLVPGKSGQTVVKSAVRGNLGGDAVVVAGRAGKGKVVLSGMNIGCRSTNVEDKYSFEERVTPGELAVLANSVFWLAERR